MTKLDQDIVKIKKQLIEKAKKRGIWENFGQKEARQLEEKYLKNFDQEAWNKLIDLKNWCMNFNLNLIKKGDK
jgi:hypothetical protein